MKTEKQRVHFVDPYLINPTNPVSVCVVGAGGTGSHVLTALGRINHALIALNHPGLSVKVFDEDIVTKANLGRQLFAQSEVGLPKAVALINRVNRFFGTNWKSHAQMYREGETATTANIIVSCVDTVAVRFEIAEIIQRGASHHAIGRDKFMYWLDFGNSHTTGQAILSTAGKIRQPKSSKYTPVDSLPMPTDEFKALFLSVKEDAAPSCSLAEALDKQDLFINSALADLGASLLWSMFRKGMIANRGVFLNLAEFRTQPLKV